MGEVADFIGSLPERMGDNPQERFDALMWAEGLSTADRDDLRWLVTRADGATEMAYSAARALSGYEVELDKLDEQVRRLQSGETAAGDLTRMFRCGLGSGLLISGAAALPSAAGTAAALPSAAGTAAAAAIAAGGAVAADVIVGVSGGIGAIALVVAGLVVMRRQKCWH